jgi:hypothetical protein
MSKFIKSIQSLLLTLSITVVALYVSLASPPVQAQEQSQAAVVVKDYDVYVDLPTAFAFIKLPSGWKFIGKLDTEQLRHLPPGTLTALLAPEELPTRMAADSAKRPVMLAKGGAGVTTIK